MCTLIFESTIKNSHLRVRHWHCVRACRAAALAPIALQTSAHERTAHSTHASQRTRLGTVGSAEEDTDRCHSDRRCSGRSSELTQVTAHSVVPGEPALPCRCPEAPAGARWLRSQRRADRRAKRWRLVALSGWLMIVELRILACFKARRDHRT